MFLSNNNWKSHPHPLHFFIFWEREIKLPYERYQECMHLNNAVGSKRPISSFASCRKVKSGGLRKSPSYATPGTTGESSTITQISAKGTGGGCSVTLQTGYYKLRKADQASCSCRTIFQVGIHKRLVPTGPYYYENVIPVSALVIYTGIRSKEGRTGCILVWIHSGRCLREWVALCRFSQRYRQWGLQGVGSYLSWAHAGFRWR